MIYEKGQFGVIPIGNMKGLKGNEQAIYAWLCYHSNQEGRCFPGRAKLAKEAGCSISTVIRVIGKLVKNGYILKQKRISEDGRQKSNLYVVLIRTQKREVHNEGVKLTRGEGVKLTPRIILRDELYSNRTYKNKNDDETEREATLKNQGRISSWGSMAEIIKRKQSLLKGKG